jgi:hypothetical protein
MKHLCANCGQLTISSLKKFWASPVFPTSCPSCGGLNVSSHLADNLHLTLPPALLLAGVLGMWLAQSMVPLGLAMLSLPVCFYAIHVKCPLAAATRESVKTSRIVALTLSFLVLSAALAFKYIYHT